MAVIIPTEIEFDPATITILPLATVSLNNVIVLTWDSTTRKLSIDNAFEADVLTPTLVQFRFPTGLSNSNSVEPITPFIIQTHDPAGNIID